MRRASAILLVPLAVLATLSVTGATTDPPPPVPGTSVQSFVDCLNAVGQAGGSDIADTVGPCIPSGCKVVVTMGPTSAQAACTLGGCLLPRVIFECPGPNDHLKFRPSYLLCPINSKAAGNQFGMNRIEAGEDVEKFGNPLIKKHGADTVPTTGKMKMADIPIPPGQAIATTLADALSVFIPDPDNAGDFKDTKDCNSCHKQPDPPAPRNGDPALSRPIDPFGHNRLTSGVLGNQYIIDVSVNEHRKLVNHRNLPATPKIKGDGTPVVNMTLDKVCECVKANGAAIANQANMDPIAADDRNPNVDPALLLKLCEALAKKIPRAAAEGSGEFQYEGTQSLLQLDLTGHSAGSLGSFTFNDIHGTLTASSSGTGTSIASVVLSSLEATFLGGGDFQITGVGTATVNGTPRSIQFQASQFNATKPTGFATFEIRDVETGEILAQGTSRYGRTPLRLTVPH